MRAATARAHTHTLAQTQRAYGGFEDAFILAPSVSTPDSRTFPNRSIKKSNSKLALASWAPEHRMRQPA